MDRFVIRYSLPQSSSPQPPQLSNARRRSRSRSRSSSPSRDDTSTPRSHSHPRLSAHETSTNRTQRQREDLRATAQETLDILPGLLTQTQNLRAARAHSRHTLKTLRRLDPNLCPSFPRPAIIRVVNEDTLDAAIALSQRATTTTPTTGPGGGGGGGGGGDAARRRPAVVNFANRHRPGGGWLNGAMAQEEALCYRSSLYLSLESAAYPLAPDEALYSPYVLVVRDAVARGHGLMDSAAGAGAGGGLPVVSALTVAALYKPEVETRVLHHGGGSASPILPSQTATTTTTTTTERIFARDRDRGFTKDKMKLALRMAASEGHTALVLGALGCGVFANPSEDVAQCWLEVLREHEFSGNWWRDVWFAVYDPRGEGNYEVFRRVLDGKAV